MRLHTEFIQLPLAFDVARMRAEVAAIPESSWRPHPQGHPGNSALPLVSLGGDPNDDGVAGTMAPTPNLNACEYLQQVLASFATVIGRSRLMRLEGRSQATPHIDTNYYWAERVRIHVPILTSSEIRFLCADAETHMASGECWIFDAERTHNVLNPTGNQRIHLVADTVGSPAFWDIVAHAGAEPHVVAHRPGERPAIATERHTLPVVMTPWELATHVEAILARAPSVPELEAILRRLRQGWRVAWAKHGDDADGYAIFARLRDEATQALSPFEGRVALDNGTDAVEMVQQLVLRAAVNPHLAPSPSPIPAPAPVPPPTPATPAAVRAERAPVGPGPGNPFTRPVIIVAPPRSGSTLLFETLARLPGLYTIGGESHALIEGIEDLHPAARGWDSNRLGPSDATPAVVTQLRAAFAYELRDRDGAPPSGDASGVRLLEKTPKNALRVPFLREVFPDALFVHLRRDPRETVASMIEAWRSGGFVTYPDLPGWDGPPWSLVLTPEWRALAGRTLAELAAAQWAAAERTLLDGLDRVPAEHVLEVDYAELVADPVAVVARVAAWAGLPGEAELPTPLPLSRHTLTPPAEGKWRAHEAELAPLLPELDAIAVRRHGASTAVAPVVPLSSQSTTSFADILGQLGSSLLVSTYQTGKLVTVRRSGGGLNTHFRDLPSPMGIAVDDGRIAVGTQSGVIEYRDTPAVAAKLAPAPEIHDACFLPRRDHVTGDIRVHDMAYDADGELWLVATASSCLATLDEEHSFVPRWTPPFVTGLDASDRCHLNGLCMVDGRPRFVTALGTTDVGGAWREHKADGGVVLDVGSSEIVLSGLSMPHSPRWHDGRLWVLESGDGALGVADLQTGRVETVARLPGFTRGLAFAGSLAFVGLSQVREATTFGGLPLTARLEERRCGVWVVDVQSGEVVAFLEFRDLVQELFEVALLDGVRFPEIAEPDSDATRLSYVVPDTALPV